MTLTTRLKRLVARARGTSSAGQGRISPVPAPPGPVGVSVADRIGELSDHAFEVRVGAVRDAEELSPAGLTEVLEHLTGLMDEIWHTLSPFQERLEVIRKGEVVVRAHTGRSVPELLDSAAVNLDYGRDGLMVARHLIAEGRAHLIAAEREGGIGHPS